MKKLLTILLLLLMANQVLVSFHLKHHEGMQLVKEPQEKKEKCGSEEKKEDKECSSVHKKTCPEVTLGATVFSAHIIKTPASPALDKLTPPPDKGLHL